MSFEPRISMELVERIEAMSDAWRKAHADGTITADERMEVTRLVEHIYQVAMDLDDSIGIAVTVMRRGITSPSSKRRMAEHGLRVIRGSKDDGPRAA